MYTGTIIQQLLGIVRQADPEPDAYVILTNARAHLADRAMDENDIAAWWILGGLQELVINEEN